MSDMTYRRAKEICGPIPKDNVLTIAEAKGFLKAWAIAELLQSALKLIIETQCSDHPLCQGNEKVGREAIAEFKKARGE
jgi:hypothetical protein